jgi:hypothetical protein
MISPTHSLSSPEPFESVLHFSVLFQLFKAQPTPAMAQSNSGELPGIWRNLHYEVTMWRRDK